jgi:hypothetical protein
VANRRDDADGAVFGDELAVMLGLVLDPADEHRLGDFSASGYDMAIAASIDARPYRISASSGGAGKCSGDEVWDGDRMT